MKRFLCMLLILALLAPAALAEAAKLEGPGYDTPEDAVLAYLDGLNAGDAQAMLSTFAYETFADHADARAYLERMKTFVYSYYNSVPLTGDYARTLVISARYGRLAGYLAYQYIELAAHLEGKNEILQDSAAIDELLDKFDQSPVNGWQGSVEFVKWLSPAAAKNYATAANLANIAAQTEYAGADDIAELAAHVRLNGVDAVQCMVCAKYGDRWYNLDMFGTLAVFLYLDSLTAGLLYPSSEEAQANLQAALSAVPDAQAQLALSSCAASTLAGTRWQLASLSGLDATVADTAEDAAGGTNAVYGELRFYRIGGALANLRFSPDLADKLGADGGRAKVTLAWVELLGMLEVKARTQTQNLDVNNLSLRRSGSDLVATLESGVEATFRKAE